MLEPMHRDSSKCLKYRAERKREEGKVNPNGGSNDGSIWGITAPAGASVLREGSGAAGAIFDSIQGAKWELRLRRPFERLVSGREYALKRRTIV
jgi:hypothetical protein